MVEVWENLSPAIRTETKRQRARHFAGDVANDTSQERKHGMPFLIFLIPRPSLTFFGTGGISRMHLLAECVRHRISADCGLSSHGRCLGKYLDHTVLIIVVLTDTYLSLPFCSSAVYLDAGSLTFCSTHINNMRHMPDNDI